MVKERQAGKEQACEYPQDTASNQADQQLNLKIRDELSGWIWDSYKGLTLNTVNGVVEIRGHVQSFKEQQDIINKVRNIEGVRGIKSALKIASNR